MDNYCFSPWDQFYRCSIVSTQSAPSDTNRMQPVGLQHAHPAGVVGEGRPKVGLIKRRHRESAPPVLPSTPPEPPLMSAWPALDLQAKTDLTARFVAQMLAAVLRPSAAELEEEEKLLKEVLAGVEQRGKGRKEKNRIRRKKRRKAKEIELVDSEDEEATSTNPTVVQVSKPSNPGFLHSQLDTGAKWRVRSRSR